MRKLAPILFVPAVPAVLALAAAVPAAAAPRAALSWHVSFRVTGPGSPEFTAVTATSGTSAWAFEFAGGNAPVAYQLSGSAWTRRAFPSRSNDFVRSASASSASNVWAFTFKGQVLRFDGSTWSTAKKFAKSINSGLAVSSTDVWVFGMQFNGTGTWHFNGHTWSMVRSGAGLRGASALSANSIWAFGGTSVAHWNGRSWAKTSLARLLPKNTQLSHSFLAGIYAASAKSVYAIGSGGRLDEGGPMVLLHFDGSAWHKIGQITSLGNPIAVIPDGSGGLWIPVDTGAPGMATMEHFSHGALGKVTLPISPANLFLGDAAIGKRTTAALTVGFTHKPRAPIGAVILRFGT